MYNAQRAESCAYRPNPVDDESPSKRRRSAKGAPGDGAGNRHGLAAQWALHMAPVRGADGGLGTLQMQHVAAAKADDT